jgi:uncharacterized membrane protein YhaH (DUF805 family)
MTRRSFWTVAAAGLVIGSLVMVGGIAAGGAIGQVAVIYGPIIGVTALVLTVRLALRDRPWRRIPRRLPASKLIPTSLQGRRIF